MRVLLDTDVVLDLLLDRAPFAEAAATLWELNEQGRYDAFISAITPVNVFYIARKLKGGDTARQAVSKLLAALHVCPINSLVLLNALALPFTDFEDAVQHAAAAARGLDAIVTRNTDDYRAATLPIYAPADILKHLTSDSGSSA